MIKPALITCCHQKQEITSTPKMSRLWKAAYRCLTRLQLVPCSPFFIQRPKILLIHQDHYEKRNQRGAFSFLDYVSLNPRTISKWWQSGWSVSLWFQSSCLWQTHPACCRMILGCSWSHRSDRWWEQEDLSGVAFTYVSRCVLAPLSSLGLAGTPARLQNGWCQYAWTWMER